MKRTHIVLITPPVISASRWWMTAFPSKPHLHGLAGFVRDIADVTIVELDRVMGVPRPGSEAAFLAGIAEHLDLDGVDMVGISCWASHHYLGSVAVARAVRALAPQLPIIVGGHHATAVPDDFTGEDALFDVVVRGDGEHVLRTLCEERPGRLDKTRVVYGRPFWLTGTEHIDWDTYACWQDDPAQKKLTLYLSRGCAFRCSFCVEPNERARWNAYSVPHALAILERVVARLDPRAICLPDAIFGQDRRWTEQLLAGIRERGLDCMFSAQTRSNLMTPALLADLKATRFKLDFGLDTASPDMIRRMRKTKGVDAYLRRSHAILRHADQIGLLHGIYLIFNHPGETPETTQQTIDFVESLGADLDPSSGSVWGQTFFIVPGSPVYDELASYAAQHGTIVRHPTWWRTIGDHHAMATDVLPSAAWLGREDELMSWWRWQQDLNRRWSARHTYPVREHQYAFYYAGAAAGQPQVLAAMP